jgi:hypothetical protein
MGVNSNPEDCPDPAHVQLTPTHMVNNAMASADAAMTKAFTSVV